MQRHISLQNTLIICGTNCSRSTIFINRLKQLQTCSLQAYADKSQRVSPNKCKVLKVGNFDNRHNSPLSNFILRMWKSRCLQKVPLQVFQGACCSFQCLKNSVTNTSEIHYRHASEKGCRLAKLSPSCQL